MSIKRPSRTDSDSYIIMIIYREALKYPHDGQWREFNGMVEQGGRKYRIRADFVLRDAFFSYKNLEVKALERELITLN